MKSQATNRVFESGAQRSPDADNQAYHLICPTAQAAEAETLSSGERRYGRDNWTRGMPIADTLNHALRHILLYLDGDRSEPHLAHARTNLGFAIHFDSCCDCHIGRAILDESDKLYAQNRKAFDESRTELQPRHSARGGGEPDAHHIPGLSPDQSPDNLNRQYDQPTASRVPDQNQVVSNVYVHDQQAAKEAAEYYARGQPATRTPVIAVPNPGDPYGGYSFYNPSTGESCSHDGTPLYPRHFDAVNSAGPAAIDYSAAPGISAPRASDYQCGEYSPFPPSSPSPNLGEPIRAGIAATYRADITEAAQRVTTAVINALSTEGYVLRNPFK